MGKIISTIILLIVIALVYLNYYFEFGTDNRANIANELFLNEQNRFDYDLLERRLNEKFAPINKREDLRIFIIRNGGMCNEENICHLNIYNTFCISEKAIIELMSEPKIHVKPFTDGC